MGTKTETLLIIVVLGILDAVLFGVPVIALILVYVVFAKPPWFINLVREIYQA